MSKSFATPSTIATRLLRPWDSPGKNTVVGCHFLLQGIFLSQGSNMYLLHQQVDSLPLSHQGSPNPFVKSYTIFNDIYSTLRRKKKKKDFKFFRAVPQQPDIPKYKENCLYMNCEIGFHTWIRVIGSSQNVEVNYIDKSPDILHWKRPHHLKP